MKNDELKPKVNNKTKNTKKKQYSYKKNNVQFTWLTNRKAAWRFMTAGFNKRNFFE